MHILHLEDDGPLREILKVALEAVDPSCNLIQFESSDLADTYITSNHSSIDLYVLDIRVPGSMNGMQVAQKIRTIDSTGAIVITSAYGRPGQDFLKTNRCEWYSKPWHILETPQMLLRLAQQSSGKKSAEPSITKPTEPLVKKPIEPSITKPIEPLVKQPTEPSVKKPTEPSATKPTEPLVKKPIEPSVTNPTEPSDKKSTE